MAHTRFLRSSAAALVASTLLAHPARAQLTISNVVKYQVIQRDSGSMSATFVDSGSCSAGTTKIQIQVLNQASNAVLASFAWRDLTNLTVSGTKWKGTVPEIPVGGEHKIQLRAFGAGTTVTDTLLIQHVLVGDVWLCSGQSNMQQAPGATLDTNNVHTRVIWSSQPDTTFKESNAWGTTVTNGPTTSFGNHLHTLLNIPIGIIYAAKGGTSIDDWFYNHDSSGHNLFWWESSMMQRGVAPWKIAGFLWYQGENEDQQDTWASRYMAKFSKLRDSVRLLSGRPHLPILAVQLESWDGTSAWPLNPYSRWVRWPVTRDQQELIGRADAWSAAAPIWPAAGLHINGTNQALLGSYCAAIATRKFYPYLSEDPGAGPVFKEAWFKDATRQDVVVQFDGVKGRLKNPADPSHLGFYVMKPSVFDINDSTIFDYIKDSYSNPAKMLKEIGSIDTLGTDKIVIHLAAPATDSVTVGYGRHINLVSLAPLTDASNVPVLTFFNRVIDATQKPSAIDAAPSNPRHPVLSFVGSTLHVDAVGAERPEVGVRDLGGRLLLRQTLSGTSLDLAPLRRNGTLLVTVRAGTYQGTLRTCSFAAGR